MGKLKIFKSNGAQRTPDKIPDLRAAIKKIDKEIRDCQAKKAELMNLESALELDFQLGLDEALEKQKAIPPQIDELEKRIESLTRTRPLAMDRLAAAEESEYEATKRAKWAATREVTNSIMKKSSEWQSRAKELGDLAKEIQDLSILAFNEAPRKDSLFTDCLLSPNRLINEFRNGLFKSTGWYFCSNPILNQYELPLFVDQMQAACDWVTKFDDSKKQLTGSARPYTESELAELASADELSAPLEGETHA